VLTNSTRLTTRDLIEIAQTRGQDHLLAISGRTRIEADVTDVLLNRGNNAVKHTVAGNSGAELSETGFAALLKASEHDEKLAEKTGLRLDVPIQLLRELQPDIRRYARRQCHRTSAIEDVVQEALIVLYRRLGNVRDPLALAGWIFRVVTRLCMLPVLMLIRGAEELTERHEAEYFAQVPKDELRIDLVRALESLPDMYREVILLRDMEQLTIGEVADHLRITREACKSRIHRGRALLREYLQGDKPRGGKK